MPDNRDTNEILRQYSSDLLELHRHFANMLEDQTGREEEIQRYPQVRQMLTRTQETVRRHISELEQSLESLGGEGSSFLKQAMGTAAGAVMGMAAKADGAEKASKMLRNNYAALEAGSLGSLMLYTTAAAFNEMRVQDMSARHFDEMTSLAVETREMVPEVVVREFSDEGYAVNSGVIGEVNQKAQNAWTRRATLS